MGELLGACFLQHPKRHQLGQRTNQVVEGILGRAAVSIGLALLSIDRDPQPGRSLPNVAGETDVPRDQLEDYWPPTTPGL
jgi:hypothetical protein